jgi:hypothetical protein
VVLKILAVWALGLGILVFCRILSYLYHSRWKPWIGVGFLFKYDHDTGMVSVASSLLKSPAGRSGIKHGSILLSRNGREVPVFATKDEFPVWLKSLSARVGRVVRYKFLEPQENGQCQEREVVLRYQKLHGTIPRYAPLPTEEQMHQDWKFLMPAFKARYPIFRCARTGVLYHRRKVIPVDDFH